MEACFFPPRTRDSATLRIPFPFPSTALPRGRPPGIELCSQTFDRFLFGRVPRQVLGFERIRDDVEESNVVEVAVPWLLPFLMSVGNDQLPFSESYPAIGDVAFRVEQTGCIAGIDLAEDRAIRVDLGFAFHDGQQIDPRQA